MARGEGDGGGCARQSQAEEVHHASVHWHQGGPQAQGEDVAVGEGQHSSARVFVEISGGLQLWS